jgi:hypothetical protein
MLGQGQALTDISQNPYQQYQGQQVAGPSALQNQQYSQLAGMGPSQQTGIASNMAMQSFQRAGGIGGYQAASPQNFYDSPGTGNINAGTVGTQDYTGANVSKYMSPYMDEVLNQQKEAAVRDYSRGLPSIGAAAAKVGGLGGTRNALMVSESQRNLQDQLAGIEATGRQSAFENARNQFNTQQQAGLQAQMANQNTGLQAQMANQNARLQDRSQLAQYGLAGAQLGEQSRQFGANLGLQGLQQQLAASGQLGQFGSDLFNQQMGITDALGRAGTQQRQTAQDQLTAAYQDFINQQNYPYKQLGFMSDLIRGTGATTQASQSIYQQPPNQLGQLAGIGLGLGSLFGK